MNRWVLSMLVAVCVGALVAAGRPASSQQPEPDAQPFEAPSTRSGEAGEDADLWSLSIAQRLELLDPDEPEAYFRLGEEAAAASTEQDNLELAQHLYVLAIALAWDRPERRAVAAGAALALADITRSEADRRALRSIASSLDARFGTRDWSRSTEVVVSDEVAYDAAVALGEIRAGWGTKVRSELKRPEIRRLIDRYSTLMTGTVNQNVLPELEAQAEAWPCPECHNERIVTKRHTGTIERRLCYTCGGNPGPLLTREQLVGQLRFEAMVLDSSPRSWGAQIAADLGVPLRSADVSELPLRFGVDVSKTEYRDGQWVEPQGDLPDVADPDAPSEAPAPEDDD